MLIRDLLARRKRESPTICHPDRRMGDVLETMRNEGLTSIPVVEKGQLIDVVSLSELIAAAENEKLGVGAANADFVGFPAGTG